MMPSAYHAMAIAVVIWTVVYGCSFLPWLALSSDTRGDRVAVVAIWVLGAASACGGIVWSEYHRGMTIWN